MPRGTDDNPDAIPSPPSGPRRELTDTATIVSRVHAAIEADASARTVIEVLAGQGELFAVGGVIRDSAADRKTKDVDLVCRGLSLDEIEKLLQERIKVDGFGRVGKDGVDFEVVRYRHEDGSETEVALPRQEISTGPGRDEWEINSNPELPIEEDMVRRDFTVNAMAINLDTGELVDPAGGMADLAAGRLRTVSPASFRDESLRILRAITLHARMGLVADEATRAQMRQYAPNLASVTSDTTRKELDKFFAADNPGAGIRLAQETGVLAQILPEVEAAVGFDQRNPNHHELLFDHLVSVMDRTVEQTDDPDVRLAAFLHDVGKPKSQSIEKDVPVKGLDGKPLVDEDGNPVVRDVGRYYLRVERDETDNIVATHGDDHWEVGAQMTRTILTRLNYPEARITRVEHLVRHHMWAYEPTPKSTRRFMKAVGDEHVDDLIVLRMADQGSKADERTKIEAMRAAVAAERAAGSAVSVKQLSVSGSDIMQIVGRENGRAIGAILNDLLDEVVDDTDLDKPELLLARARELAPEAIARAQAQLEAHMAAKQIEREETSRRAREANRLAKAAALAGEQ